ncbi:hypothetical protein VTN00DRAFT_5699 [Thermoascus crustaceus]|uniref:uncharacterized protein n=1 Tax=Thermoascus crustaceus TaxID=5088 RepID=UPI003744546F
MFRFPSPRLAHLRLRLAGSSATADTFVSPLIPVRHASLTSAIGHGIRKSRGAESSLDRDRRGRRPQRSNENDTHEEKSRSEEFEFDEDEFIRTGNFRALPRRYRGNGESDMKNTKAKEKDQSASSEDGQGQEERPLVRKILDKNNKKTKDKTKTKTKPKQNVKVPASIPYTTPASEFIYGTTAVEAALRCTRRKLYKLYIYQGPEEDELSEIKIALQKLALSKGVHAKIVYAGWDRLLDKMSAGRPHNGVILEASPLPKLPITSFEKVEKLDFSSDSNENNIDHFKIQLAPQSREEAAINGTSPIIPLINPTVHQKRYPLTLLLDGILDPGNLGAIIRSAYFLGIDAIAFAGRNSAPLSPVTIKASAGAAENMTLLKVTNNTVEFMKRSQENGWRFYAADAPQPGSETISSSSSGSNSEGETPSFNLLRQAPTVIMLGSEGTGLSPQIRAQADAIVGIPSARRVRGSSVDIGIDSDPARVDSLNVSVAAALLMEMFLRHPLCVSDVPKKTNSKASKKK